MLRKLFLCFVGVGLSSLASYAQNAIVRQYQETMGDNALIYSGKLEDIYASAFYFNRPYLESDEYFPGEIVYNQKPYDNLRLRFNLFQEQLIVLTPEKKVGVELDMRKISGFTIGKRKFAHIACLPEGIPEQGYIHVLFDGKQIKVLVKHKCITKASVFQGNASYMSFDFRDKYYIGARGNYHPMKNVTLLYRLFPQYKQQLKTFVRKERLNFKKEREYAFYKMAEYLQILITQTTE